ncbi:TonB-dependent receptor [uncultured Tenacibaculum sp.]|nr:TonB-dependent receptor [uncultured Tenacibaculum sp.]
MDTVKNTHSFKNRNIGEILEKVFENSDVNFHVLENNKVVLTKGYLIKRSVYQTDNESLTEDVSSVVFEKGKNENFIKIGRESLTKKTNYTVKGYVKNITTKKAIEGVSVYEKSTGKYVVTNKNGFYSINVPFGKNELEVSFIDYEKQSKNIIVFENGNLDFFIRETSEQLDEIVIDGNINKNVKQTIAGVTQIKAEKIKNIPLVFGERDILKVATTLPGIKSTGEGSEGVNVRGGKVDQNLFLLDDGIIYNPTHFLGLFSAVNPFTTKDVKIYKGSTPAEYGGRLSSVFDINSKNPNTTKFKGEASIGPVTGNLSVEIPVIKDKSGLMLGVRSTYSDWILNLLDKDNFENSSASFYDVIAKYNHKINDNNSLEVTGYHSLDKYQIASDSINKYGNSIASINWRHQFNEKNTGNLILSNSKYFFSIDFDDDTNQNGFNLDYNINETNLKLKMKYLHSETHNFDYGLESKLYNISPGTILPSSTNSDITPLSIAKERALENAVFLADEIKVTDKLNVNVGLRFSQFLALGASSQNFYQNGLPKNSSNLLTTKSYGNNEIFKAYHGLSYRLSGRYSLTEDLSLKGSFNKSFQYIHRLNNNTTATPIDTWRLSNVNIKPQIGRQVTLGLFKNIKGNKYELSLEGYFKDYDNLLDYKTGATLLLNENIETDVLQGDGKSYGVEFLVRKNEGRLNGWLGYSYSRSLIQFNSQFEEETINNGKYFPTNYDKPHDFSAVLNYKLTERYSFSANLAYQTGRPITYPTGKYTSNGVEFLTYSFRNQFRIPDYYRLDIGINIEGNHKIKKFAHSFWNISIYNVLGRNNPYSIFFETVNGNVNGYKSSIFSNPIPTITYNFKF